MITIEQVLEIPVKEGSLEGILVKAQDTKGVVLFAHGTGSGRSSPRNQWVASHLNQNGFSTLLFDLLTEEEESTDERTHRLRFDIELLASRLVSATDWVREHHRLFEHPFGYFGASTGAAAALVAATERPYLVKAVVSRGGRPDLAGMALGSVRVPTLLIVGENDTEVLDLNHQALKKLVVPEKEMKIIPGATHLFEEPDTLEKVARLSLAWFEQYMNVRKKEVSNRFYF